MKTRFLCSTAAVGLMLLVPLLAAEKPAKETPKVKIPEAGVPQNMTMEGRFIRVAYNNEGYAVLGYRLANQSVGEKWMLLEIGLTVRNGVPDYTLTRDALSLETPFGQTIPMATLEEYRAAPLGALQDRAKVSNDSINYFPPDARMACRIGFFADLDSAGKAWDQVVLNSQRGCMGQIYFQVPEGIAYGQHWLNVKFAKSVVRVPFRILTEQEYKFLDEHYNNIEKQVEDAFKKKN